MSRTDAGGRIGLDVVLEGDDAVTGDDGGIEDDLIIGCAGIVGIMNGSCKEYHS